MAFFERFFCLFKPKAPALDSHSKALSKALCSGDPCRLLSLIAEQPPQGPFFNAENLGKIGAAGQCMQSALPAFFARAGFALSCELAGEGPLHKILWHNRKSPDFAKIAMDCAAEYDFAAANALLPRARTCLSLLARLGISGAEPGAAACLEAAKAILQKIGPLRCPSETDGVWSQIGIACRDSFLSGSYEKAKPFLLDFAAAVLEHNRRRPENGILLGIDYTADLYARYPAQGNPHNWACAFLIATGREAELAEMIAGEPDAAEACKAFQTLCLGHAEIFLAAHKCAQKAKDLGARLQSPSSALAYLESRLLPDSMPCGILPEASKNRL